MKIVLLTLPMMLFTAATGAQDLVPPEVVRLENLKINNDMKTVYVGNTNKHFVLSCNVKVDGCITPRANKNYLLFDAHTRWKMPDATEPVDLTFLQNLTVEYNQGENIGLIAEDAIVGKPVVLDELADGEIGVFLLLDSRRARVDHLEPAANRGSWRKYHYAGRHHAQVRRGWQHRHRCHGCKRCAR